LWGKNGTVSAAEWLQKQAGRSCPVDGKREEKEFASDVAKNIQYPLGFLSKPYTHNVALVLLFLAHVLRLHKTGDYKIRLYKRGF
jgi:hypothetical protein